MKNEISILIPCYNSRCYDEVKSVWQQANQISVAFEIIVAEDGSTDEAALNENAKVAELEGVRYLPRRENVGRAAIRNFLAREAKYKNLLFMDSDLCVEYNTFIKKYLDVDDDIVVGGLRIFGNAKTLSRNLRYKYERGAQRLHSRIEREKHEHREFRTTNFMITKKIMENCPFDENFKSYGYEDVLFGKALHDKGYHIRHITNPVTINDYEDNETFVSKTEESLRTLHEFRAQLKGYSKLLKYANTIRYLGLSPIAVLIFKTFGKTIRKNLAGNNPRLSWFNKYKLLYYLSL